MAIVNYWWMACCLTWKILAIQQKVTGKSTIMPKTNSWISLRRHTRNYTNLKAERFVGNLPSLSSAGLTLVLFKMPKIFTILSIGSFRVENSTVIQMKIQTKFVFEFKHSLPQHSVRVWLLFAWHLPNCLIEKFNYLRAQTSFFVANIILDVSS